MVTFSFSTLGDDGDCGDDDEDVDEEYVGDDSAASSVRSSPMGPTIGGLYIQY